MKKIDLHIHTKKTSSDTNKNFTFSLDVLEKYVEDTDLDAIAITNHNTFDLKQFEEISTHLDIVCFPGVEIDLVNGHILFITSLDNQTVLHDCCEKLYDYIESNSSGISYEEFIEIFPRELISNSLLIPHYDKNPNIDMGTIKKLNKITEIQWGEVSSHKKFLKKKKDKHALTPVMFSDSRIEESTEVFSNNHTYIRLNDITINGIKLALRNKKHVEVNLDESNEIIQLLPHLDISTGLNVVIGERSSGKTYLLEEIVKQNIDVNYIKQFELVMNNTSEDFHKKLQEDLSSNTKSYLLELENIVATVKDIDLRSDKKEVNQYIESLKNYAEYTNKQDVFSRTKIFNENKIDLPRFENLSNLLASTESLIENKGYEKLIDSNLGKDNLKNLYIDLAKEYSKLKKKEELSKHTNQAITNIKDELFQKSTTPNIKELNLVDIMTNRMIVERFNSLVNNMKEDYIYDQEAYMNFKRVSKREGFKKVSDIRKVAKSRDAFSHAFKHYENPYDYMLALKEIDSVVESELHKYFINVVHSINNDNGEEISGGERTEFNFLKKIKDSMDYDYLIIDEPEGSFDNLFLNKKINNYIKDMAEKVTVIISTHNNTIGASINPDHLVYCEKIKDKGTN
ncbi:hypothetical protein, partial [Salinicoccus sp. YB14-2]|uniref:hypothetical protein n=1 Tax=Salinicoccus sp. YB14-2 TaxID=1572701 RepID=UPI000690188D